MRENFTMYGYIDVPQVNKRLIYTLEDNCMTISSGESLPLEKFESIDLSCDIDYLIGNDLPSGRHVIFFVDHVPFSDEDRFIWSSVSIKVYFYIISKVDLIKFNFNGVQFRFEELNIFFDARKGIKTERNYEEGQLRFRLTPPKEIIRNFNFTIADMNINAEMDIYKTFSSDPAHPISLFSVLNCYFKNTLNINLVLDLYTVIKRLFCFLSHRKSIQIDLMQLIGMDDKSRTTIVGELYILFERAEIEDKKIINRIVKHELLESHFTELIQLISDNQLYIENIPENYQMANHITPSSFILDAAAFEWTFKQCYDEIPISKYRENVKKDILLFLDELPKNKSYDKKDKKELRLYSKIIMGVDISFSEKVLYALNDFDPVLKEFIERIYQLNGMPFVRKSYSRIAEDLQYQRNAYAHGDIDKELRDYIISDTIILEWLNYCMVFKSVGYSNDEIFNIINAIFERHHEMRYLN